MNKTTKEALEFERFYKESQDKLRMLAPSQYCSVTGIQTTKGTHLGLDIKGDDMQTQVSLVILLLSSISQIAAGLMKDNLPHFPGDDTDPEEALLRNARAFLLSASDLAMTVDSATLFEAVHQND